MLNLVAPSPLWGKLRPLVPLALLVVSGCAQASPSTYVGIQARTPIDKIPAGGEMKNFTLVATNPLIESKFNLPRGSNGGMSAIRDCLYVGSNIANQPMLVLDMKDMTKPTVIGDVPGIPGRSMGTESFQGVGDLNFMVVTARTGAVGKVTVAPADKTIGMVVLDVTN